MSYRLLADVVLSLHVAIVLFVVGGLVAIVVGHLRGWRWAEALSFRLAHLAAIGYVVVQQWLGAVCPLTDLEMALRAKAHSPTYRESFIGHWLRQLLYWDAPPWAFTFAYTIFGLAVAATWWYFPPRRRRGPDRHSDEMEIR